MHRACGAEQHGTDCDAVARRSLEEVESDVRRIQIGHEQQVRFAFESRIRIYAITYLFGECHVPLHLSIHFEVGRERADARTGLAHFDGARCLGGPEARVRKRGDLGRQPEAADFLGREHGEDDPVVYGVWLSSNEPVSFQTLHGAGDTGRVDLETVADLAHGETTTATETEETEDLKAGEGEPERSAGGHRHRDAIDGPAGAGKSTVAHLFEELGANVVDADRLADVAAWVPSKVNLIMYNPVFGVEFERSPERRVNAFIRVLVSRGVTVTVRRSRGQDIDAACGQLAVKST